ncbi:extracellular solute-binding protein [Lampropedia puyangensis]|uniref:Extracellular solute-binding protein n=1 Tax=Lampropedia puyangensis TaxID=1330072 RepID=A0A4S8FBD2_9BURK|nr:extracellular solute-binding protein [Lampropedia puyangensis]THU04983.1 extracellular solute-binding protein [Lampropedia puyangensis]
MPASDHTSFSRRHFLAGASAVGAGLLMPQWAQAQSSERLVAMAIPGTWERSARSVVAPAFKKATGADVTISPALIVEALAKLSASKGNPPYDVVMMDEPAQINAKAQDLLATLPKDLIPNLSKVPSSLIGADGMGVMSAMQVFGIAYNAKTITTPPKTWDELWSPSYKGRVLISGPDTTIGLTWMVELAKMHGGSETNLEPAWKMLEKLRPNLATIPANPGAVGPLFQQGQADIALSFLSVVEPLRLRGVDVAIAKPETGWGVVSNIVHITKGTRNMEHAAAYVNALLDTQVQEQLAQEPYFSVPSNNEVAFTGAMAKVAKDQSELLTGHGLDWVSIAAQRQELIDRFNRDFRRR